MLVEAQELVRTFRRGSEEVQAVSGVSLELREGELLALTGPSGSGKSTLVHLIAGLLKPDAGTVRTGRTALVFQAAHLVPWLTVRENLDLAAALSRVEVQPERRARTLATLALGELVERRVPSLSRGQVQRVAVARAIETAPDVLLLDEPTAHLDSEASQNLVSSVLELTRQGALGAILATHDPELVPRCDRSMAL